MPWRSPLNYLLLLACWQGLFVVQSARADAIVISQALKATSIAEFHIDETGIRTTLEVGLNALPAFSNMIPDEIYREMGLGTEPFEERLRSFLGKDMAVLADGELLRGSIRSMGPEKRILRDPINGTPLPVQENAPDIISVELFYPFTEGALPTELVFDSPLGTDIGFVVYHKGVAVNDYRFLAPGYTLTLDWLDPWYSTFANRSLKRRYSEPMSGFIYVENFEVRKEIIVRPKDLQRWTDLGLAGREDIPAAMQPAIKEKVGAFLAGHHPVTINGKPAQGILESVNFLERTLTSSRVIDPPEDLDIDSAIMGAIFVFPRDGLPQSVTMDWDLWDERITRIPVSSVDQAGPLPTYLEPDWRVLEWTNYLKNPTIPTLQAIETPATDWQVLAIRALPALICIALLNVLWLWRRRSQGGGAALPALGTVLFLAASILAARYGASNTPDAARAQAITDDLLHNIYRAFDYREESDIYDVLARSVSGDLLTDIFLETKRSLVLANQGGASAKVKDIQLESVTVLPGAEQGSFSVEADWTVHGSVGHWGHIHQRSNRYLANLTVAVDAGQWKLQAMDVLQEERL